MFRSAASLRTSNFSILLVPLDKVCCILVSQRLEIWLILSTSTNKVDIFSQSYSQTKNLIEKLRWGEKIPRLGLSQAIRSFYGVWTDDWLEVWRLVGNSHSQKAHVKTLTVVFHTVIIKHMCPKKLRTTLSCPLHHEFLFNWRRNHCTMCHAQNHLINCREDNSIFLNVPSYLRDYTKTNHFGIRKQNISQM